MTNMRKDYSAWWIAVIMALAMCGPFAAKEPQEAAMWVLDSQGQRPEPERRVQTGSPAAKLTIVSSDVAVRDVCAWPNLTLLPDGTIVAMIYNQPSHLQHEGGDLECWASTDAGKTWARRGTPAPHEPRRSRANVAAGLAHNGDLVVLVSGWSYAPGRRLRRLRPWVCRSSDQGRTWSVDKSCSAVFFPDGADYEDRGQRMIKPFGDIVALPGGRLAASFYHDYGTVWIHFSNDDGRTWSEASVLSSDHRGETAILRLRPDRWLAASRIERGPDEKTPALGLELFVSEDEGRTWTPKGPLTSNSGGDAGQHPGHLLRLKDGRILLTFGMRDFGAIGIRASDDEGQTWRPGVVLQRLGRGSGGYGVGDTKGDLGYPATVQLSDGSLVTAYYYSKPAYHMGVVRWSLGSQ